jgi:hypothetical protein
MRSCRKWGPLIASGGGPQGLGTEDDFDEHRLP